MIFTDNLWALICNYSDYIQIIIACIISAFVFIKFTVYIAMHPQKRTALLKAMFCFIVSVGIIVFCTCNYYGIEKGNYKGWVDNGDYPALRVPYIVLRSIIDVGRMFYGYPNTDVFYATTAAQNPWLVLLFWLMYATIFYTVASALLIRFGNDLLRWIRIWVAKKRNFDVDIVFGINQDSIVFGRNLADKDNHILIFIDSIAGEDYESSVRELGGIIYSDSESLNASEIFLENIDMRPHNKKLRLYAMSYDYDKNIQYAQRMSESLAKKNISPEQTELILLGTDEMKGMIFQADQNQYGYGNVISFDEYEISARLLINEYPLCSFINFDEEGLATEDVDVLIGGFGRIGHEVLRKVIANGRFEGSKLNIWIFDPKHGDKTGFIRSQYPKMFQPPYTEIEIHFASHDVRSSECFSFLQEHASTLKYVVICLEDRDTARDIAARMIDHLQSVGHPMNIYTCDPKSIRCYSHDARKCRTHWIYESSLICSGEMDKYAIELNHRYMELYRDGSGSASAAEDWRNCDYFGRMSSRASVDYLIPLIRKITEGKDTLTHEQRENLSKSEHLRWCAFHYTFGYDSMDFSEFIQRVKNWQKEINERGKSSIKITKDTQKRLHVCLTEWDELDKISRAENEITHGTRDYKENDRKNVDMVLELIQIPSSDSR